MQIYQAWITNSKLFSQFFSISGVGDLSFSQSRHDDCHGSEVSELECLVSDNNENNNVCEIYKSDYIHHPHQPDHLGDEDVLEGHRDRRKDDSGCATASLEILSASCHTPATDLPSLNSLSLAREAEGWPQGEDKSRKTSRKTSNNSNHSGELLNSGTSSMYELNRNITCFGPWALSLKNSVVILSKRIADLAHSCVIVAVVTCLQHSPWWPGSAPTAVRSSSLLLIWLRVHSAPSSVPQYTNIPTQVQMQ